ncbi:MAG: hypothetical protein Q4G66_11815 [bacterium]|nr:hypothetical protein [bacterium]
MDEQRRAANTGLEVQLTTDTHSTLSLTSGRIQVRAELLRVGEDVCVVLSGGDRPHVGCATLSVARPSLADSSKGSATTSIFNVTGHKDGEAAQYMSQQLSTELQKTVVVCGGIHVAAIQPEEIQVVMEMVQALTTAMIEELKR